MGFEVNAISLPVGHPGNSLNPDDDSLNLELPPSWRYRVDKNGENEYFCACIEENMVKDNFNSLLLLKRLGFKKVFFDDDLRLGVWGNEITGCFCKKCINEFNSLYNLSLSRDELKLSCLDKNEISSKWIEYSCSKITNFMKKMAESGLQVGIMVMHNGGKYHGIDIEAIKEAVPDCMFRVGELHFDDEMFENDLNHISELTSMKNHLTLMGENAYSETTVFPPYALKPENFIKKIELARSLNMENIFLMSGTWVMSDEYWKALKKYNSPVF